MSEAISAGSKSEGSNKVAAFIRREIGRVTALASLFVIFTFFTVMRPVFASWANVSGGILMSTTVIGLMAIGVTFVIITGGIDLSVGTSMALVGVITGKTVMAMNLNVWSGILLGMIVGTLLGAINGVLITVLKLPPFIATLATMKGAQGLALITSDLKPILFTTDVKGWDSIAQGNIIPNLPNAVLILLVSAIVASIILNKTVLGRYTFAIGSIGGTSLLGGKGTISGTIIGALIMSVLINGLRILELQQEWQYVVVGAVILLAVYGDNVRRRRAGETTH